MRSRTLLAVADVVGIGIVRTLDHDHDTDTDSELALIVSSRFAE